MSSDTSTPVTPLLQGQFQRLAAAMQSLPYSLLDVAANSWAADIAGFRSGVEDLEKQLTAALQQGFDSAGPLSAKMRLLPVGCTKPRTLTTNAHLADLTQADPKHSGSP